MKKLSLAILVIFLGFQATASAQTISGKVASIDAANSKLTVNYLAPEGTETKSEIAVKSDTTYSGISSLEELKEDDSVTIETTQLPEGSSLVATSISKDLSLDSLKEQVDQANLETVKDEAAASVPAH